MTVNSVASGLQNLSYWATCGGRPTLPPNEVLVQDSNMSAIKSLNPKAEVARFSAALEVNMTAARGLQDVLKTNLGPKGTMKM